MNIKFCEKKQFAKYDRKFSHFFAKLFLFEGNLSIKKKFSVFAKNFDFLITLILQPNVVDLGYFI